MLKKIALYVLVPVGSYYGYCVVRGAIWGVRHMDEQMTREQAYKIASFRG